MISEVNKKNKRILAKQYNGCKLLNKLLCAHILSQMGQVSAVSRDMADKRSTTFITQLNNNSKTTLLILTIVGLERLYCLITNKCFVRIFKLIHSNTYKLWSK